MQYYWHWDLGYPSRVSGFETPEAIETLGIADDWINKQFETYEYVKNESMAKENHGQLLIAEGQDIMHMVVTAMSSVVTGEKSATAALDLAESQIDKLMRDSGYY